MSDYRINTLTKPAIKRRSTDQASQVRDLVWGRPKFKAPQLQNPRVIFDPIPFTAHRPGRMVAGKRVD